MHLSSFFRARLSVIDTRAISLISSRGVYYVRINYTNACNLQCLETIDLYIMAWKPGDVNDLMCATVWDTLAIIPIYCTPYLLLC